MIFKQITFKSDEVVSGSTGHRLKADIQRNGPLNITRTVDSLPVEY